LHCGVITRIGLVAALSLQVYAFVFGFILVFLFVFIFTGEQQLAQQSHC